MGKPMYVGDGAQWLPVAGGGSMGGLVPVWSRSFTAQTEVSADGVFKPGKNYRFMIDVAGSASDYIRMFMRAAGVDDTSSSYYKQEWYFSNASAGGNRIGPSTYGQVAYVNSANPSTFIAEVFAPATARPTRIVCNGFEADSDVSQIFFTVIHDVATAFDGCKFAAVTGTLSGEITIYEYTTSVPRPIPGRDRLWTPQLIHSANDEFNDGILDPTWTRVDTSGEASFQELAEGGDSLSIRNALGNDGSGPKLHGLVKPYALAVGEYIQCHLKVSGQISNYPAFGLVASDGNTPGTGNQHVTMFIPASGFYGVTHGAWTSWNSRTAGFADTTLPGGMVEFHYRMMRDTGNVWRVSQSPDGVLWDELSTHTHSLTPTHIGLAGTSWGSTTPRMFSVDYFRVGS